MKEKEKIYRHLTEEEISVLEGNYCQCADWTMVEVADGFDANRCLHVMFSGQIRIGSTRGSHLLPGGLHVPTGINIARLHNCIVGDEVVIFHVNSYLANYRIGDYTRIENIDTIAVTESTSFGNGVEVTVLNETGGREVTITDNLTAQTAYLMAMYRHDKVLTESLAAMARAYAESRRSDMGAIGSHVVIHGCNTIENVCIGDYTEITGASHLCNGSINSKKEAPVSVGYNVVCRDFILCSGSSVTDGATVSHCFVGQGTHLGHLFSAHDSLFFANCQGENGEACAVFAGPYTVSMHKSSLLIAGLYSFLNAGSGSNQSNHLYKLGPIHQGIVERGSKTTSDSYILWPSRIGPFTLVMGRHVHHIDSSAFPFSYIIEDRNESYLVPGINLRSVGTIRDAKKWPARDKRKDPDLLDNINFNLLSPFTAGKMMRGSRKLKKLRKILGSEGQTYVYHDMRIRSSALDKGLMFYEMGLNKFFGNSIIKRLEDCPCRTDEEVLSALKPIHNEGDGSWVDICGMIAPQQQIHRLASLIKEGKIKSLAEVNERMKEIHSRYYDYEWCWAYNALLEWYELNPEDLTRSKVAELVHTWMRSVIRLDEMLYEDAKKEFQMHSQVGFGIDLVGEMKHRDFDEVRGDFESNPFIVEVVEHIRKKRALGEEMLSRLE